MKKMLFVIFLFVFCLGFYYLYPERRFPENANITRIDVHKSSKEMLIYDGNKLVKKYKVSVGRGMGKESTPEGSFAVKSKNSTSGFHKALVLLGLMEIHGIRNGLGFIGKFHRFFNWTKGCIAVTDLEIDELFDKVKIGTPVYIYK